MRAKLANSKNAEHGGIYLPLTCSRTLCKRQLLPSLISFSQSILWYDFIQWFNINTIKEYEMFRWLPYFKFTNGSIFEIGQCCWDRFTRAHLTNKISTKVSPQALKNKFDVISNTGTNLLKKEDKLRNYLNHVFQCQPQNNRKPPYQQLQCNKWNSRPS